MRERERESAVWGNTLCVTSLSVCLPLSLSLSFSLSLSLSLTHTHTHTRSLSLARSLSQGRKHLVLDGRHVARDGWERRVRQRRLLPNKKVKFPGFLRQRLRVLRSSPKFQGCQCRVYRVLEFEVQSRDFRSALLVAAVVASRPSSRGDRDRSQISP